MARRAAHLCRPQAQREDEPGQQRGARSNTEFLLLALEKGLTFMHVKWNINLNSLLKVVPKMLHFALF